MLGSITCDTDISELISVDDVSPHLSNMESSISNYKQHIVLSIVNEQRNGGLSRDGFSIDGIPLLSDSADNIVNGIANNSDFESYKSEVISLVQAQREKEIATLIERINEKINSLSDSYNTISNWIAANGADADPGYLAELNGYLDTLANSIANYSDKLEAVRGLS